MVRTLGLAGLGIAGLTLLAGAQGLPSGSKCSSGEAKAVGAKTSCKLGVVAAAAKKGAAPAAGKLATCEAQFTEAYATAQSAADCLFRGNAASMEAVVDRFVNDVNTSVAVSPPSKCQSAKLKAVGKKVKCRLGVEAKAYAKNRPGDPVKAQACVDKMRAKFSRVDGGADCGTTVGDYDTIRRKVGEFEDDVRVRIEGELPPPTCCGFHGGGPRRLLFTTALGSDNCGTIRSSAGSTTRNLACGGLYTGGGLNSVPLPYAVPDMEQWLTRITACNVTTNTLTLRNLTSADSGSDRNCTSVGCLFGAPLPIPNPVSTPTSVCVINTVATDAIGSADCATGASNLSLPLTSTLHLTGDLFPNAPGIQVCPVCNRSCNAGTNNGGPCNSDTDCPGAGVGSCAGANVCHGGPNDGAGCAPADTAVNASFPTSHDCPPPPLSNIGGLPIAFNLSTGTQTLTAVNNTASGQINVFCGYCRDNGGGSSAGTGCFEGDPNPACPVDSGCIAAGNPFLCCTGAGTGTCDQPGPKACGSNADCADGSGTWPDCMQRTQGAFGPAGGGAHTITETGSPAANLTDGLGHASTLVSIFCIRPTFNATVDAAGDLPGPGAVAIPGMAQLLP